MIVLEEDIIKAIVLSNRDRIKAKLKELELDSELEAEYLAQIDREGLEQDIDAHLELRDEYKLNALENQSPEC